MKLQAGTIARRLPARSSHARRFGAAVVMVLAVGPAVVIAAPSAQAATPTVAATAAYESRVINAINIQRAKFHRGKLYAATCPDIYAERWGAYLARSGRFYHQSLYPILRGCRAHVVAENLARGNVSPERIVAAWMASPGHRANILDGRLTRIGVAAVFARGQWTVAADFSRP